MPYTYPRTDAEVDDQLNKAADGQDQGTKYAGMSYEDGIEAAVRRITGETEELPL